MIKLKNEELENINGGAIHFGIALGISAGITFLIGLIDGYVRPLACRK